MLIVTLLQLVPGIFLIFRHTTAGKFSKNKTSDLATFFILGTETAIALILLSLYFIFSTPIFSLSLNHQIFAYIIAGILIALGLFFLFFYFKKGSGTRLFISRRLANTYIRRAKSANSRSDAFLLGMSSILPELIFTLPLYLLSVLEIPQIATDSPTRAFLIILFAIITIAPIIMLHGFARTHNSADFIKFRFKNKNFCRIFIPLLYFLIAILIILGV